MTPAAAFIARTAGLPFVWGQSDCACWTARHVWEATGHDPSAGFRGAYDSRFGYRRILMEAGGLLAFARRQMAPLPAGGEGDGVCVARAQGQTLVGVLSAGRLFVKKDRGVLSPPEFDVLERWVV